MNISKLRDRRVVGTEFYCPNVSKYFNLQSKIYWGCFHMILIERLTCVFDCLIYSFTMRTKAQGVLKQVKICNCFQATPRNAKSTGKNLGRSHPNHEIGSHEIFVSCRGTDPRDSQKNPDRSILEKKFVFMIALKYHAKSHQYLSSINQNHSSMHRVANGIAGTRPAHALHHCSQCSHLHLRANLCTIQHGHVNCFYEWIMKPGNSQTHGRPLVSHEIPRFAKSLVLSTFHHISTLEAVPLGQEPPAPI